MLVRIIFFSQKNISDANITMNKNTLSQGFKITIARCPLQVINDDRLTNLQELAFPWTNE